MDKVAVGAVEGVFDRPQAPHPPGFIKFVDKPKIGGGKLGDFRNGLEWIVI